MDKKGSDLEHKLIKKDIEQLSYKMHDGFLAISESLKMQFESLRIKSDAESEVKGQQLDAILAEQKKTNGRVKVLETVTSNLKYFKHNPKVALLVIYAIYNAYDYTTIKNGLLLLSWFKSLL